MKDLENLINIGIPCYSEITLPIQNLTLSCAKRVSPSIDIEREIKREIKNRVERVINVSSLNNTNRLFSYLNLFADNDSISKIDWSKRQRLMDLFWGLSFDQSVEKIGEKHKLLCDYITYINENQYSTEFHNGLKKDFFNLYYGRDYGVDLRYYLERENAYYTALKNRLENVLQIDNSDLYQAYFDSMHLESVGLYIAECILEEVKQALKQNDFSLAQEKLFYLNAYFNSREFSGLEIRQCSFHFSFDELKDEYKRILETYPTLKDLIYERSFFYHHEIEENKKVIDSLLKMEKLNIKETFIKEGKTYEEKESSTRVNKPLTIQEKEAVEAYLFQKLYTYLKNNPKAQIDCSNKFSNYTAFLFENGEILADRFKGVNRLSETQSDAIYVFDASNFESEIKKNKQDLIGKVPRIFHNPGWEEKVEEVAMSETSEELKEQGKKLIKKINRF